MPPGTLVDAGIARVPIAVIDPTSRGEGGAARFRGAGIDAGVGLLANEALIVLGP
jgi:diaminohydroxyphosphoribosylaminopyrimidine deaminase/5-amino-6-(5-phosphoribosylamino)uracil reductase